MVSRPPLVVTVLIASVCTLSAVLTLAAPANDCEKPETLTRNTYRTPVAAALEVPWLRFMSSRPRQVSLNLPPSLHIDTAALRADIGLWSGALNLYRDSSWFASAIISPRAVKQLHGVYDVRPVADTDFLEMLERFELDFPPPRSLDTPLIVGSIYRVSYEACRGWPCHDGDEVEVRRVPGGYIGCRMLMMGTE